MNQAETRQQVEDLGRVFEKMGFTPMQGRILAYLSAQGGEEKSFDEILQFFRTSKSTVSNSINYLLSSGLLDYRTRSGNRKRFFFLTARFPAAYIRMQEDLINAFKEQVYRILSSQSPENRENNSLIHQWIDFANRYGTYLTELKESALKSEEKKR